jgi:hypothetical protein
MKAKCVLIIRNELHGNKWLEVDYSRGGMLSLGNVYMIYGISLWQNSLNYLIVPKEASLPNWYPVDLFEIMDESFYSESYFGYFGGSDDRGLNAIWGYKELVKDHQHYVDLIEREPDAIRVFLKRKKEIDESSKEL